MRCTNHSTLVFLLSFLSLVPYAQAWSWNTRDEALSWNTQDECPSTITTTIPHPFYASEYRLFAECKEKPPQVKPSVSYYSPSTPCSNITSLNLRDQCQDVKPLFDTMATVHSALTTCPNITSLDLRLHIDTHYTLTHILPDRWNFPFNPDGSDKFPPLKSLRLEGYGFGISILPQEKWDAPIWNSGKVLNSIKSAFEWIREGNLREWKRYRKLDDAQRAKSNLDLWLDAMEWEKLEELHIIDDPKTLDQLDSLHIGKDAEELVTKLPPRLHSIKNLSTTSLPFIEGLTNNALTSLAWVGPFEEETLPSILRRQGQSLERLELRCSEWACEGTPMNEDLLDLLITGAPHLRHLSVNIHRNGTWPFGTINKLSSIPSLRSVEIWLNIQSLCRAGETHQNTPGKPLGPHSPRCRRPHQFQRPYLDEMSALMLFGRMRDEKIGERLENLTFWAGDWKNRRWSHKPHYPWWLERKTAKIVCSSEGKGEGLPGCDFASGEPYWCGGFGQNLC